MEPALRARLWRSKLAPDPMNNRPMLKNRRLGLEVASAVALLLIAGVALTWWTVKMTDTQMRNELLQQAQVVAQGVNIEHIKNLSGGKADLESPDYQRLNEQFAAIKQSMEGYRFIYLMGRRPDGQLIFFVDNEPAESKERSMPGEVYKDATDELRAVFDNGIPFVEGPEVDDWGIWVSALVPIFAPRTGKVLAVLGIDVDVQDWRWIAARRASLSVGLILVALIFLAFSLALARSHSIIRVRETELRESEKKYRYLFERAEEGIIIVRGETIEFANPATSRMLGQSLDTITTTPFATFIHPEDRDLIRDRHRRRMQGELFDASYDFRVITPGKGVRWLHITSQLIDWEGAPASMCFLKDTTEQKMAEERIRLLAVTDSLTGIANRREFTRVLEKESERSKRYATPLSLLMYDLDFFKQVNDTFGHKVGDDVLRATTAVVRKNIRTVDMVARWGGEEFMVLMPGSNLADAKNVAEKLRQAIAQQRFGTVNIITASFGVAEFASPDDTESLLKRVDDALYRAKTMGRNRVEFMAR